MKFYDAHAHCVRNQAGGLLIGLEGCKSAPNSMSNKEVQDRVSTDGSFQACYYVTNKWNAVPDEKILKYHPRREQYSPSEVIEDLRRRQCKLCVIDTLNQPHWDYLDYWRIVSAFPMVKFILPHMGGYDVKDFVKILDFNKNVYCDFSMTQEYFGWCGQRPSYGIVCDTIDYCLSNGRLNKRIMFGSDEPDFSQEYALRKYCTLPNAEDLLVKNYLNLMDSI